MKKLVALALVLPLLLAFLPVPWGQAPPPPSGPRVYYVDNTTGNDANSGTSPSSAWQHIHYAATNGIAIGQCSVLLNSAEVFQEPYILWTNAGASSNAPILISSYNGATATISNNPIVGNLTQFGLIQIAGNYQTYSNLSFQGNPSTTPFAWVTNANNTSTTPCGCGLCSGTANVSGAYTNVVIASCTFSNLGNGIYYYSTNDGNGLYYSSISNNTITTIGGWGILPWGQSTYYHFNYIGLIVQSNNVSFVSGLSGINSGDGIAIGNMTNGLVTGNVIHDCGYNSGGGGAGAGGIVIVYSGGYTNSSNETYHIYANTSSADGIGNDNDLYTANYLFEKNYSHDNQGAGLYCYYSLSNITIRFNVSEANCQLTAETVQSEHSELSINSVTISNIAIYGNTFLATVGTNAAINGPPQIVGTNYVCNNILFSAASNSLSWAAKTNTAFNGNWYGTTATTGPQFLIGTTVYTGLAAFIAAGYDATGNAQSGTDPYLLLPWSYAFSNSLNGNGLANTLTNWTPATSSPLVNAGVNLSSVYGINQGSVDFRGTALTSTPNIGAVNSTGTPGYTNVLIGLIGWWQFSDGSGTGPADWSGNRNGPTLANTPTWQSNYITMTAAGSQHATLAANAALCTVPLTWTAWIRATNVAAKENFIFGAATGGPAFLVNGPLTNNLALYKDFVAAISYSATAGTVSMGVAQWTHVACTWDGTTPHFYINGASAGVLATTAAAFTTTATLGLGYDRQGATEYVNGDMRSLCTFNRILSAGEISDIYNLGLLANMNGVAGQ